MSIDILKDKLPKSHANRLGHNYEKETLREKVKLK